MWDMPVSLGDSFNECIWIPPGFAHGNVFLQDTIIQYLCSGEYSQGCEAGISPLANDIDWSLCSSNTKLIFMKHLFDKIKDDKDLKITQKDEEAFSLKEWKQNENSKNFIYGKL